MQRDPILWLNFTEISIGTKAKISVIWKKDFKSSWTSWTTSTERECLTYTKIIMTSLLPSKSSCPLCIKIYGVPRRLGQDRKSWSSFLALSIQMEQSCLRICGFSKAFAGNLTLKYVFCWMWGLNLPQREFWSWSRLLRTRTWEVSQVSWVSMPIFSQKKEKKSKVRQIVSKNASFLCKKPNNLNTFSPISLTRTLKVR